MKKCFVLTLALCLLAALPGCGATSRSAPAAEPEPSPPPVETPETITYEVITAPYERTATADDGTELMRVSFQLPRLRALADGVPIETPATPAQEDAQERADRFNGNFDQWRDSEGTAQNMASAQAHYEADPEWFGGLSYAEELTHTVYRAGSLISVSGLYYSFTGGAHPNTWLLGWNFDLRTGEFFGPEVLAEGTDLQEAVTDELLRQARTPDETGWAPADGYWEEYEDLLANWPACAVTFDEAGMRVEFSAYELAPYAAGEQSFHVPYELLREHLDREGLILLGLEEAEL